MKRIFVIAGAAILATISAVAQDEVQQKTAREEIQKTVREQIQLQMDKLKMELQARGEPAAMQGVMGQPVLAAPYSATEVSESTQTLEDGTRIHHENQAQVYRDGAGRTRRETGNTIVIMDPVAKVRYTINTERKTATALPLRFMKLQTAEGGGEIGFAVPTDKFVVVTGDSGGVRTSGVISPNGEVKVKAAKAAEPMNTENLGPQAMEGVVAQGSRNTRTIETGEIGNDRPINITNERWYSPQLQTVMMTRQNDPRIGESVFRLTNVKLGEPAPTLFQVPAGYQVTERK